VAEIAHQPTASSIRAKTVTVNFSLRNFNLAPTTNLVATLLPSGGVTSPSASQNFGALTPGGAAVARPFTFVAGGSCGGTLTATLQLQDGPANRGSVTFTFPIGQLVTNSVPQIFSNALLINILDKQRCLALPEHHYGVRRHRHRRESHGDIARRHAHIHARHRHPARRPGGQRTFLMSDAGSTPRSAIVTLTFETTPRPPGSAEHGAARLGHLRAGQLRYGRRVSFACASGAVRLQLSVFKRHQRERLVVALWSLMTRRRIQEPSATDGASAFYTVTAVCCEGPPSLTIRRSGPSVLVNGRPQPPATCSNRQMR